MQTVMHLGSLASTVSWEWGMGFWHLHLNQLFSTQGTSSSDTEDKAAWGNFMEDILLIYFAY